MLDKTPLTPATKDLVKKILDDAKKPVDTTKPVEKKTPKEVVDEIVKVIKEDFQVKKDESAMDEIVKVIKETT